MKLHGQRRIPPPASLRQFPHAPPLAITLVEQLPRGAIDSLQTAPQGIERPTLIPKASKGPGLSIDQFLQFARSSHAQVPALAGEIAQMIHRDPSQPPLEPRFPTKTPHSPERRDKDILRHIIRSRPVPDPRPQKTTHPTLVPPHQLAKSLHPCRLANQHPSQQLVGRIIRRFPVEIHADKVSPATPPATKIHRIQHRPAFFGNSRVSS